MGAPAGCTTPGAARSPTRTRTATGGYRPSGKHREPGTGGVGVGGLHTLLAEPQHVRKGRHRALPPLTDEKSQVQKEESRFARVHESIACSRRGRARCSAALCAAHSRVGVCASGERSGSFPANGFSVPPFSLPASRGWRLASEACRRTPQAGRAVGVSASRTAPCAAGSGWHPFCPRRQVGGRAGGAATIKPNLSNCNQK